MRSSLHHHWVNPSTCLYLMAINPWPFTPWPLHQVLGSVPRHTRSLNPQCFTQLPESPRLAQPGLIPWPPGILHGHKDLYIFTHTSLHLHRHETEISTRLHKHLGTSWETCMHKHVDSNLKEPYDPVAPHPSHTHTKLPFTFVNLPSITASAEQFSPFSFWHTPPEKNSPTILAPCSIQLGTQDIMQLYNLYLQFVQLLLCILMVAPFICTDCWC